jgi:hypothetical protein
MGKIEKNNIATNQLWYILIYSTAVFVISYLIVFTLSALAFVYISSDFQVPVTLSAVKTIVNLSDNSILWSSDKIISIYASVPFTCFFIGVFSLFIFHLKRKSTLTFLAGIIWTIFHAFTLSFGQISLDLLMQTGFARAANQMGAEIIMTILTIGVGLFFLFKLGTFIARIYHTKLFPGFTNEPKVNFRLFLWFFLFPWLAGNIFILLLSYKTLDLQSFLLPAISLIMIIPIALFNPEKNKHKSVFQQLTSRNLLIVSSVAVLAMALVFMVLSRGITLSY